MQLLEIAALCSTLEVFLAPAVLVYTAVTELAHVQQVESMATFDQPEHSHHSTLDALNCGTARVVPG